MNTYKLLAAATAVAIMPIVATAATFNTAVFEDGSEDTVANGGLFSIPLTIGNDASVTVADTIGDAETTSFVGFSLVPSPANYAFSISLSSFDAIYAGTVVSIYDDMAKTMLLATGVVKAREPLDLSGRASSPLWIELDYNMANLGGERNGDVNTFNYDVGVSAVPVPAAGLLLLGGLGGLAALRRKKA